MLNGLHIICKVEGKIINKKYSIFQKLLNSDALNVDFYQIEVADYCFEVYFECLFTRIFLGNSTYAKFKAENEF